MKKIIVLVFCLLSLPAFAGEIQVKVNGMVCSLCAQGIEKKFKSHEEVKAIKVNLNDKFVMIETKEGQDLSDKVVTKIIQEAGYNVAKIERK